MRVDRTVPPRGGELLEAAAEVGAQRLSTSDLARVALRGGGCPVEHAPAADGGSGTRG